MGESQKSEYTFHLFIVHFSRRRSSKLEIKLPRFLFPQFAQFMELQDNDRKIAGYWFDSQTDNASLCAWKKTLNFFLFPLSSLYLLWWFSAWQNPCWQYGKKSLALVWLDHGQTQCLAYAYKWHSINAWCHEPFLSTVDSQSFLNVLYNFDIMFSVVPHAFCLTRWPKNKLVEKQSL